MNHTCTDVTQNLIASSSNKLLQLIERTVVTAFFLKKIESVMLKT
jgi:hypothetical protein